MVAVPAGPPPPSVPEGWKAHWNADYKAWFFENIYTEESTWEKPTEPVYPPKARTPLPPGPPPGYTPAVQQQTEEVKSVDPATLPSPMAALALADGNPSYSQAPAQQPSYGYAPQPQQQTVQQPASQGIYTTTPPQSFPAQPAQPGGISVAEVRDYKGETQGQQPATQEAEYGYPPQQRDTRGAQPDYPPQQPGYPPQQPGYPPQQPGYPPQQPGYPPQQPGYLSQQPGYPPQQPGYLSQQPGYPPQQPGYPPQQPGYPPQQPGYPPQQPSYPQQPGYPPQQQIQQPGYPPQLQQQVPGQAVGAPQKGPGGSGFMNMLNSKVGNKVPGGAGTILGVGAGLLAGGVLAHEWEEHEEREKREHHGFGGLGGLMRNFGGPPVVENITINNDYQDNNTFSF